MTTPSDLDFSDNFLRGAEAIAIYIFGTGEKKHRRIIYHWVARSNFPAFRFGAMICARKSVLHEWIEKQELKCLKKKREETDKDDDDDPKF